MTQVYTFTLGTGQIIAVSAEADAGDIFITKVFIVLLSILIFQFAFTLVYRR